MVNKHLIAGIIFCQFFSSACSLKNWWGEQKRVEQISQSANTGKSCAPIINIVASQTEEESEQTLNCWSSKLNKIWSQIEGENKNSLSEAEIATLVRKGILDLPGDSEITLKRILTGKKLVGFFGSVDRKKLDDWLTWAQQNRIRARFLYRKFKSQEGRVLYSDLQEAIAMLSSGLERMNWKMDSHDLAYTLTTVLDLQDEEIRAAVAPGAEVAINVLNSVCPSFKKKDTWEPSSLGACLTAMAEEFKTGAPWFEFLANPVDDLTVGQVAAIQYTLDSDPKNAEDPTRLTYHVNQWFHQPHLGVLLPTRWFELARRMGANPPNNLIDSLQVIRRFKSRSNEKAIYPEAAIYLYQIAQQAQLEILNGLPLFIQATHNGGCANSKATYWSECVLADYGAASAASSSIAIATAVKNINHGATSAPLDGHEFSKIMFFHTAAARIIDAFQDENTACNESPCQAKIITTDIGDENDKLVQLITVGVASGENIQRFYSNIRRKFNHLPLPSDQNSFLDRRWNIGGFARLVAMSSDILVKRTPSENGLFIALLSNLIRPSANSVSLDQLAVTAILTTVDSLPQYRESYLDLATDSDNSGDKKINRWNIEYLRNPETQDVLVNRTSVIKNLRPLLKNNFPRTYQSCEDFGFETSCELAFDSLLSSSKSNDDVIPAAELDIITIIASAMEGLMDNCDYTNRDGFLRWDLFNGNDELDCGFDRTQAVVQRLIDSNILKMSNFDSERTKGLLNLVNINAITRVAGKVSMARGTTENLLLYVPLFWKYPYATIGSIYGLIADIADPDRARQGR